MRVNRPVYDVCIVGSGPGGGIAAYVLANAGLKVVLVEAGRRLQAGVDYNSHGSCYAKLEARLKAGYRTPLSSVAEDYSSHNHFTPVGDNPRHGLLRALGGRSLCWAGHSLRFGPLDFRQWPITYDEVAPYYSRAERFMSVYGEKNGLWNMPDGEFQKPVALRCGERMLARGVRKLKKSGRTVDLIGLRKAMPTEAKPRQRAVCHYCGHCMQGCEVDAKYTSANTPIPLALKTGNLTVLTESMMTRVLMDNTGRRVVGIEYAAPHGVADKISCRALVLACSTVETARHLLINKTREFPNGLANGSGEVGKNLSSHFGVTVMGVFPELTGRDSSNDDGTDYYNGLVTSLYWDRPHPNFTGTYQIQCGSGLHPTRLAIRNVPGFGLKLKRELYELNATHAGLNMQGALLASPRTFVDLDPERRDSFGLPLPRIHLTYGPNDLAMARDMVDLSQEIISAAGGKVFSTPRSISSEHLTIDYNHWVGTTRMGTEPRTSVLNASGQSHEVANLFVGDSSVFTAYPEKNPTLTNIALSWRMSDHLVRMAKSGELS